MELPLSKRLYEETKSIHSQIESMPFILAFRNEALTKEAYIQHLMDLEVIYKALEEGMRQNLDNPCIKSLFDERLCREKKIQEDIQSFCIKNTQPSKAAQEYAKHLNHLSVHSPSLLLSHAYIRYLGDLSGGRMMKKWVENMFPEAGASFYDFDELLGDNAIGAKFVEYKNEWKKHLDNCHFSEDEKKTLVREAQAGFEFMGKIFKSSTI